MDTRAPFDDPEWSNPPPEPLGRRLAAIEERLDAIEGSLRTEIARDLQTASEEMRRAVSELGRLLLRDLDRLTRVLGEHRDEIVDRLTPAPAAPGTAPGTAPPAALAPTADGAEVGPAPAPGETLAMTGEDGRWRVPGRRRKRSRRGRA